MLELKSDTGRSNGMDFWVDKHKPCSLEELVVHKKEGKVDFLSSTVMNISVIVPCFLYAQVEDIRIRVCLIGSTIFVGSD